MNKYNVKTVCSHYYYYAATKEEKVKKECQYFIGSAEKKKINLEFNSPIQFFSMFRCYNNNLCENSEREKKN